MKGWRVKKKNKTIKAGEMRRRGGVVRVESVTSNHQPRVFGIGARGADVGGFAEKVV